MCRLSGKRIIVTGGSKGIGASAVQAFVAAGADVVSMARSSAEADEVVERAAAGGPGTAHFVPCDVGNRAEVDQTFDAAVSQLRGLDVLLNCAGIHLGATAEDTTTEMIESLFRTNVLGTVQTNQAAFRHMAPVGAGAVINFGSESGISGNRQQRVSSGYGLTKAAVHSWTRHAAREWGPFGIRVNVVLPYVWTPMYQAYRDAMTPEVLARHEEQTRQHVPLGGQLGDPDTDLAPVLVFLASDESRFITGQMIPVDGGVIGVR